MHEPGSAARLVDLIGIGVSVMANAWLLFVVAPSNNPLRIMKRATLIGGAIYLGTPVLIVALWAMGFKPPGWFGTRLFELVITGVVLAMLSFVNLMFHGMVDAVIAFHETHNAANLHRFPLRVMIERRSLLKRGATWVWFLGSSLMFYGIWTDTQI